MKKIKYILFSLLVCLIGVGFVNAASIKVSANKTNVVVGSTVTVTVKVNGGAGWEYDLSYDSSVFSCSGSTHVLGGTLAGNSSVSFTLKAIKSGSSNISVKNYSVLDDASNSLGVSPNAITVTAKTQAEIEASYSTNADLSNLTVEGYELSPEFAKNTLEYELTVPNDVEKVNVVANKADGSASVKGAGEIELSEGSNKVEVVVTAQKGNTKTYVLNITRQELNPIYVTVDGKQYSIVRKADSLDIPSYYNSSTVVINGEEVPCFESEITGYTLVGLKDEEGNISLYIYNSDGTYTLYKQFATDGITFIALDTDEVLKGYESVEIMINDESVKCLKYIAGEADYVVVYGMNAKTGEKGWYQYDLREGTFQRYQTNLIVSLQDDVKDYLLLVICFATGLGLSILAIITLMIMNGKKKNKLVKMLAVMENGEFVNKEFIVEEVPDAPVDTKKVKEALDEIHEEKEVDPEEEKVSLTLEIKDLPVSEEDEEIEIEEEETEEIPVILDDEDVGGYNETKEIETVSEEPLSKRELRKLEKEREKEEKRRIAKAQREFLDDDLTSTSIFDTFVPENDEEVTSKRRGRPRKK